MADGPKKKPKPDLRRWINVNEPFELKRWSKELGVSEIRIREAVAKGVVNLASVKKYLRK